jgi:putative sigma-54 modulation protein
MRIEVKGRNVVVSDELQERIQKRLEKIGKQVSPLAQLDVELSEEKNPSIAASHVAEGTIYTKGPTIRCKEASRDMKASIDQLAEKLERQVKRYREKRREEPRRHAHASDAVPEPAD